MLNQNDKYEMITKLCRSDINPFRVLFFFNKSINIIVG